MSLRITVLNFVPPEVVLCVFDSPLANFMKDGNPFAGTDGSSALNERRRMEAVTTTGTLQTIKETQFCEEGLSPRRQPIFSIKVLKFIYLYECCNQDFRSSVFENVDCVYEGYNCCYDASTEDEDESST